jgi:hypothetical protein
VRRRAASLFAVFPAGKTPAANEIALLVTGKDRVAKTVPVVGPFAVVHPSAVVSATSSVNPSARRVGLGTPEVVSPGQVMVAWPYDIPAQAVAITASPKNLFLNSDIFSPDEVSC